MTSAVGLYFWISECPTLIGELPAILGFSKRAQTQKMATQTMCPTKPMATQTGSQHPYRCMTDSHNLSATYRVNSRSSSQLSTSSILTGASDCAAQASPAALRHVRARIVSSNTVARRATAQPATCLGPHACVISSYALPLMYDNDEIPCRRGRRNKYATKMVPPDTVKTASLQGGSGAIRPGIIESQALQGELQKHDCREACQRLTAVAQL